MLWIHLDNLYGGELNHVGEHLAIVHNGNGLKQIPLNQFLNGQYIKVEFFFSDGMQKKHIKLQTQNKFPIETHRIAFSFLC